MSYSLETGYTNIMSKSSIQVQYLNRQSLYYWTLAISFAARSPPPPLPLFLAYFSFVTISSATAPSVPSTISVVPFFGVDKALRLDCSKLDLSFRQTHLDTSTLTPPAYDFGNQRWIMTHTPLRVVFSHSSHNHRVALLWRCFVGFCAFSLFFPVFCVFPVFCSLSLLGWKCE